MSTNIVLDEASVSWLSRNLDDAVERQLPLQKGSNSKTYLRCHKLGMLCLMSLGSLIFRNGSKIWHHGRAL